MAAGGARLGEAPTSEGEDELQQPLPEIEAGAEAEAELDEGGEGGAAADSEGDQPANAFAAN